MSGIDKTKASLAGGKWADTSSMVLIAANLIPLLGVLMWDWSVFNVVVLYWLENVILGGINILKMITCAPDPKKFNIRSRVRQRVADRGHELSEEEQDTMRQFEGMIDTHGGSLKLLNHASKLFFIPFFTVHYGIFCLVHGGFVFMLLGSTKNKGVGLSSGPALDGFFEMIQAAVAQGGIWAVLALAGSHLFSFFTNYLGKGEFRRTALPMLMAAPYGRIVILHIAILFGAFAIVALGSSLFLLILLIAGKIILDIMFHLRSHRKLAS